MNFKKGTVLFENCQAVPALPACFRVNKTDSEFRYRPADCTQLNNVVTKWLYSDVCQNASSNGTYQRGDRVSLVCFLFLQMNLNCLRNFPSEQSRGLAKLKRIVQLRAMLHAFMPPSKVGFQARGKVKFTSTRCTEHRIEFETSQASLKLVNECCWGSCFVCLFVCSPEMRLSYSDYERKWREKKFRKVTTTLHFFQVSLAVGRKRKERVLAGR